MSIFFHYSTKRPLPSCLSTTASAIHPGLLIPALACQSSRRNNPAWLDHLTPPSQASAGTPLSSGTPNPDVPLEMVCYPMSLDSWDCIRNTQLREDDHSHRGNGAGAMATIGATPLNMLDLTRVNSIRAGLQAVMHDITAKLSITRTIHPPA